MTPSTPLPPDFIDQLAQRLYTPERMAWGAEYASYRGLDANKLRIPWVRTEAALGGLDFLWQWRINPSRFADCLFVPQVDLRYDPDVTGRPVLAGFDIRYCGPRVDRATWTKIKRDPMSVMLYNVHEALRSPWTILVEASIDAESLRALHLPVVAALTATGSPQFTMLMYGLFERVFIMYDNDKGGAAATRKMLDAAKQAGPEVEAAFTPLVYSGGDPNEAYRTFGGLLHQTLLAQLPG